jgi:hypothetical protein
MDRIPARGLAERQPLRFRFRSAALLSTVLTAALTAVSASAASRPTVFAPTGNCVDGTYVVPPGITQLKVTAVGNAGGSGATDANGTLGGPGGAGSRVTAILSVTPGETLSVNVADGYVYPPEAGSGAGAGPGGATQEGPVNIGGPGGAASWIWRGTASAVGATCKPAREGLLVVAAGGGGGGGSASYAIGGAGGTEPVAAGRGGNGGENREDDGEGGSGATATAGGVGGRGGHNTVRQICQEGFPGLAGEQMLGGFGGAGGSNRTYRQGCQGRYTTSGSGGGGGGGYWGGGGGGGGDDYAIFATAAGGGGGAGSSYLIPGSTLTSITAATSARGTVNDPASVTIEPVDTLPEVLAPFAFSWTRGTAVNATIRVTGYPIPTIVVSGLPDGVRQTANHDGTITLSGTPSVYAYGVAMGSVRAHQVDSAGAVHVVEQPFTFTVNAPFGFPQPSDTANFKVGTPGTFTFAARAGYPAPSVTVTGALPSGMTLKDNGDGTGSVNGTPTVGGIFPVVVRVSNGIGSPATLSLTITVTPIPTTVALTSSKNPATPGEAVTFTATVTPAPDGYVQFTVDGVKLAYVKAISGVATAPPVSTLTAGSHTVTAELFSTGLHANSSGAISQQVIVTSGPASGTALFASPATSQLFFAQSATLSSHDDFAGAISLPVPRVDGSAGLAIDHVGTLYFAQADALGQMRIARRTADGTTTPFNRTLTTPRGVALDPAGNVYAGNGDGTGAIVRFAPDGTWSTLLQLSLPDGSGQYQVQSLATDAAGNVYFGNVGRESQILLLSYPYTSAPAVVASGFSAPGALAVDHANNLFVADPSAARVFRIDLTTGARTVLQSAFAATSLAVDAAGTLYLGADSGLYRLPSPWSGSPVLVSSQAGIKAVAVRALPSVAVGQPLTLRANVLSAPAGATPAGTVTFRNGTTVLAADVALNASAVASATVSTLPVGQQLLTATYNGSAAFPASTSWTLPVTVTPYSNGPIAVTVRGTRVYGSNTVAYTATPPSTLPAGVTGIAGTVSCFTTTTSLNTAGSYDGTIGSCSGLTPTGANAGTYSVAYVDGGMTITNATVPVDVTGLRIIGGATTFSFTQPNPLPATLSMTGTLSGCTTSVASNAPPGTYANAISLCTGLSLTGARAANYTLLYNYGAFTVSLPTVTVTVTGTKPFGGGVSPTFTWTPPATFPQGVTGIAGTLAGCTTSLAPTAAVGSYPAAIQTGACSGLTLTGPATSGFTVAYSDGGMTVTPRSVQIRVTGAQLPGGTPVFRFARSGMPADVTLARGPLTGCQTTVTAASAPGLYAGTISNCSGVTITTNDGVTYPIVYVDNGFTVGAAPTATTLVAGPSVPASLYVTATGDNNYRYQQTTAGGAATSDFRAAFQSRGMDALSDGTIVVVDLNFESYRLYNANGTLQQQIPYTVAPGQISIDSNDNIIGSTSTRDALFMLEPPYTGPERILLTGASIDWFALGADDTIFFGEATVDGSGLSISALSRPYTGDAQVIVQNALDRSMTVDRDGNVYVMRSGLQSSDPAKVFKYAPPYTAAATQVPLTGVTSTPGPITGDPFGNVFVADLNGIFQLPNTGGQSQISVGTSGAYPFTIDTQMRDTTVASGAVVTLSATVASTLGGIPGGTVSFYDGATLLGTAALDASTPPAATFSTTALAAGTHLITARYGATAAYGASTSAPRRVNVGAASPTITFTSVPAVAVGAQVTVTATASSGLPVQFSTTSTNCSVTTAGVVRGLHVGSCTITGTQPGDATRPAAIARTVALLVNKGTQTIAFGAAPSVVIGGTGTVTATGGTSGQPLVFSTSTPAACSVTSAGLVTGISFGSCIVEAVQDGTPDYDAAPRRSLMVTIARAPQSITFGLAPSVVVGGQGTVTATGGASGNPVTFSMTTGTCSVTPEGVVTGLSAGNCTIVANQTGTSSYNSASPVSQTFAIALAPQSIIWGPAPSVIVGGTASISATATSGLPVTFSTASTNCSVTTAGVVTGIAAGPCMITARQAGNSTYALTTKADPVTIAKGGQTITFGSVPTLTVGATSAVSAAASSGLPVTFSTSSSTCSVTSSGSVTAIHTGTCVITAQQTGDANRLAAPDVLLSIGVDAGTQSISVSALPAVTVGSSANLTASATSGLDVTFSSSSNACSVTPSGTVLGISAGPCAVTATQPGNLDYLTATPINVSLTIGRGPQSITFDPLPVVEVATSATLVATATSGRPVTFSTNSPACAVTAAGDVTGVSTGTCVVEATQPGNADHAPATATVSLTVARGRQSITFAVPPEMTVGATGLITATATTSLPVTFSSSSAACSITAAGLLTGLHAGPCVIAAAQEGSSDYFPAPAAAQTIAIEPASQTITFEAAPAVTVGGSGLVQASSSSGLSLTFSTASATCSVTAGGVVTGLGVGDCVVDAAQGGNDDYLAAPAASQTLTIGQGTQTITFGVAPSVVVAGSGTVTAASSSGLAVTFSSTSLTCSVTPGGVVTGTSAGACVIDALQAGDFNYLPASSALSLDIGKGSQSITLRAAPAVTVGSTGQLSATSTAALPVTYSTTSATCSVSAAGELTGVHAGPCDILASQPGNDDYLAAPDVLQTITIGQASQAITFNSAPSVAVGGTGAVTASSTSGLEVSFSTTSTTCSVTAEGVVTGVSPGPCIIAAAQNGNADYLAAPVASRTITVTPGAPKVMSATAGSPQSATVQTSFATALQVRIVDADDNPVSDVTVTFTAPGDGASGTFASSAIVATDGNGLATAPAFTANGVAGSYVVSATAGPLTAGFSLTNTPGVQAAMRAAAGTPQSAMIDTQFSTPLQALVTDASGNPVDGVSVTFAAPAEGASGAFESSSSVFTDANGLATAPAFHANSISGSYDVTASAGGLTATFALTNTAGGAEAITAERGTPQSAAVHTAFGVLLQARVADAGNNPLAGVSVTFSAPANGASGMFAATPTVLTDSDGIATAPAFVANAIAGSYDVTAMAGALSTTFSLTNVAGTAASMTATAGTPQSATVNADFATAMEVRVADAGNHPLSGISVTFEAPLTGASGTFAGAATMVTNSDGIATAPAFTANDTEGSYHVTATAGALTASFALTNTPLPPTHFLVSTPPTVTNGSPFNVTVTALDASERVTTGYTATVRFTSDLTGTTLPVTYTFVAGDRGSHTFTITPNTTPGTHSITVTDVADETISGTGSVTVATPGCSPAPAAVAGITMSSALCPRSTGNAASVPAEANVTSWTWEITNGAITSGQGTNAIVYRVFDRSVTLVARGSSDAGCIISQRTGSASLRAAPTATIHLAEQRVCAGSRVEVPVTLTGSGPFTIIWSDGVTQRNIRENETSRTVVVDAATTLRITSVTDASCTSGRGSRVIDLRVDASPIINTHPRDTEVKPGERASLIVVAAGNGLTYEWFEGAVGDESRPAGSGATFLSPPLTHSTGFWVRVSNGCGSVSSQAATVTVASPGRRRSVRH